MNPNQVKEEFAELLESIRALKRQTFNAYRLALDNLETAIIRSKAHIVVDKNSENTEEEE